MGMLSILNSIGKIGLVNKGDSLLAYITPKRGLKVVKLVQNGLKQSAVRYPNGSTVITTVIKNLK